MVILPETARHQVSTAARLGGAHEASTPHLTAAIAVLALKPLRVYAQEAKRSRERVLGRERNAQASFDLFRCQLKFSEHAPGFGGSHRLEVAPDLRAFASVAHIGGG